MDVTGQSSGADTRATNDNTTTYAPESHSDAARALSILADGGVAGRLVEAHVSQLVASASALAPGSDAPSSAPNGPVASTAEILAVGLAALDAFLQANVTGPILPPDHIASIENRFVKAWTASSRSADINASPSSALQRLRRACLGHLDVDGVSPYAHISYLELFSLARYVFTNALAGGSESVLEVEPPSSGGAGKHNVAWMRLRINIWHYKLLTQPSLGPGSNFTKSSQWSDVPTLASNILDSMDTLLGRISGEEVWSTAETWSREEKAQFLVEAANNYILLGRYDKAKDALKDAAQLSGLVYALSGALGKRTKFQEKSTSQLVVLARSGGQDAAAEDAKDDVQPDTLQLNDDTLLEEIHFTKESNGNEAALPPSLADLSPDHQPQLSPLDQIILLTEATIKDAFSRIDTLTSEEVLPFAVRVLADKSTNWQIYTQALLVRSRIEVHRSRTVERGVLQLQAVADQVLTDTTGAPKQPEAPAKEDTDAVDVPAVQVTGPGQDAAAANSQAPTSFLPAPKASESAPAHIRLRYIHALCTPPRWHLESELAYAWAGVGSLSSALEIFKRLRLWAEVALCLASAAAVDDAGGRGSGGEEKAKAIIRWRLFHQSEDDASVSTGPDDEGVEDSTILKIKDYSGPERTPPPTNAARLWCILGDLESNPSHYERAWEISKRRYARAQKSLGEHYLQQKDWNKAQEAYKLATTVNRLSPEIWSRLGDVSLRLGKFEEAAEAFNRSISSATDTAGGEDARTWSNLGSALWSLYCEVDGDAKDDSTAQDVDDKESEDRPRPTTGASRDPSTLLTQALAAYKKGASIAHENWRIWDNVLTLASRMRPPPVPEIVLAFKHIIRIRKSEEAIDADVISALLQDVVLVKETDAASGVYDPPRGSMERLVTRLLEEEVVPLITQRSELWVLVARLRTWRRDYAGAIDASERAWRAAVGSSGSGSAGLLPGDSASANWTADEAAWAEAVERTDELVSVLENWGPDVETVGARWRGKARSAVRSVMGRGRGSWEGSDGWRTLEGIMEGLKAEK
ncbi:Essential for maintenance of the cell wall protein 1 [Tolypocladium ophioglossoides CBS 100239]|uniref:Essential for maintenance of the cell wall protein 1 n=1 Tax=Tolypocladium ophioglossoides (strain CBS 100239) TaxID=1163406 RepID=A0A0L0NBV7_TOLOC|nr:Essential for maintenance of the cell wall protein 1 [Tolypocladium ophioglossoides CBS 100239]